jgi:periplasmic protein TonB
MSDQESELRAEQQQPSDDVPVLTAEDHLRSLYIEAGDEGLFSSIIRNIKEAISPPKLPPLRVTSKPVPVKDIWAEYGYKKSSGLYSVLVHVAVVTLLFSLAANRNVQQAVTKTVSLVAPLDIAPYVAQKPKPQSTGGGGGGGDRSPLPASKGRLPKFAPRQFTPPMAVVNNLNPKLIMEPTLVIPPDVNVPNVNMAQYGDPLGKLGPPSNGPGSGGGIGSGSGGGVGSGRGAGYGPGEGGGFGGGVYRVGGGVTAPTLVFKVEPEYSEEARKAKFQGIVLLYLEVNERGLPQNPRVIRALGLGLDEKAIEAVMKWRFRPGLKDGKPVTTQAQVEVNFRLL